MPRAISARKLYRSMKSVGRTLGGSAIVVLAGLMVHGQTAQAVLPLPALSTRVQPVIHFLLDTSGSMDTCDGGYVDDLKDLTGAPSGGFLFDPSVDNSDDGDCDNTGTVQSKSNVYYELSYDGKHYGNATSSTPQTWTCPTAAPSTFSPTRVQDSVTRCQAAGLAGKTFGTRHGTVGTRVFAVTRLEAVKLSFSRILDVNGSGTIDTIDEQILRVKISFSHFDTSAGTYQTNIADIKPLGSSFNDIWTLVRTLHAGGATPSGAALAGARAMVLRNCWDGLATTACNLGPGQNNTTTGDDLALACRKYYVVFLTDGEPNGGANCAGGSNKCITTNPPTVGSSTTIVEDPVTIASALVYQKKAYTTEAAPSYPATTPPVIRTIGIGFGSEAAGTAPNKDRVVINCMTYLGSVDRGSGPDVAADADKDFDANPTTMSLSTNGTGEQTVTCSGFTNASGLSTASDYWGTGVAAPDNATQYFGNGYFASDSHVLVQAFKRIINAIQAGTFSRSDPTLAALQGAASTTDQFIYTASFDVPPNGVDWRGHLEKFRYVSGTGYEDCLTGTPNAVNPSPCWDAGSLLRNRDFRTRTVYLVNPTDYPTKFKYDNDYLGEDQVGWQTTDSDVPDNYQTVWNLLDPAMSPNIATVVIGSNSVPSVGSMLYSWAAMSTTQSAFLTYLPTDTGIPPGPLAQSIDALAYAAGRPDSTFTDGSYHCLLSSCSPTTPTFKLGDSYQGRPIIVGPPVGLVSDPDYVNEFRTRPLTTAAGGGGFIEYVGGNQPKEGAPTYMTAAAPCPTTVTAANCTVQYRRSIVLLPANDGSIHAFSDETGEELWSFIPPGHMQRLKLQLDGRTSYIDGQTVVRDVKFPCERQADGSCKVAGGSDPFEDGKWHTVLYQIQGAGGNFIFALDITNPVAPKFLWEYRDPSTMGILVTPPAVSELPLQASGLTDKTGPGSAVFLPGGYFGATGTAPEFHTLTTWSGVKLDHHQTNPVDLDINETRPGALVNGMTGIPKAVDANLDGHVDRVYFGDREGRMWKACNILPNGTFSVNLFFDPALYDVTSAGHVGQPVTANDPTSGYANANGRKELRGPIWFAPDVTRNHAGSLNVAFGSGDLTDPLDVPSGYYNFVWNVTDNIAGSGAATCDGALANSCTGGATAVFGSSSIPYDNGVVTQPAPLTCPCWVQSTNQTSISSPVGNCINDVWPDHNEPWDGFHLPDQYCGLKNGHSTVPGTGGYYCACAKTQVSPNGVTPGSGIVVSGGTSSTLLTTNVVPLSKMLAAGTQFFNGLLFYTEFEPDPNVCSSNFKSRIYNLDAFSCGAPPATAPLQNDSANGGKPSQTLVNSLVTGVEINPTTGTIFVQSSTPGNNPPAAINGSGMAVGNSYAGWKQNN